MSADSGDVLAGEAHLRQSVRDILTTPIGSRVMRREYGSRLFELVDGPLDAGRIAQIVAAAADALDRWEPRYRVRRIGVAAATGAGHVSIDLDGEHLPEGVPLAIAGVTV